MTCAQARKNRCCGVNPLIGEVFCSLLLSDSSDILLESAR